MLGYPRGARVSRGPRARLPASGAASSSHAHAHGDTCTPRAQGTGLVRCQHWPASAVLLGAACDYHDASSISPQSPPLSTVIIGVAYSSTVTTAARA